MINNEREGAISRVLSNAGLGLAGRATESLKALSQQLGAVVRQAVEHKPIWVFFAAAMISLPSYAETPAVDRAQIATELASSGNVIGKGLDQSAVQRMPAKTGENGRVDSGAESSGGFTAAKITLNLESTKDADKRGDQDDSGTVGDYLQAALLGLLLAAIPMVPIFMRKPNVEVTGAARLYRAASG